MRCTCSRGNTKGQQRWRSDGQASPLVSAQETAPSFPTQRHPIKSPPRRTATGTPPPRRHHYRHRADRHGLSLAVSVWHCPAMSPAETVFRRDGPLIGHPSHTVVDHVGCPVERDEAGFARWVAGIKSLGELPNVHCKVSGLIHPMHTSKVRCMPLHPPTPPSTRVVRSLTRASRVSVHAARVGGVVVCRVSGPLRRSSRTSKKRSRPSPLPRACLPQTSPWTASAAPMPMWLPP